MHNYMFRKFYSVKCGGAVEVGFRFFFFWGGGAFLLLESRVWPSGVDKALRDTRFRPTYWILKLVVFFRDVLSSSARRQNSGSQLLDMEVTLVTRGPPLPVINAAGLDISSLWGG
jgi:hypothetical protein